MEDGEGEVGVRAGANQLIKYKQYNKILVRNRMKTSTVHTVLNSKYIFYLASRIREKDSLEEMEPKKKGGGRVIGIHCCIYLLGQNDQEIIIVNLSHGQRKQ
jgi:hypothetical protein